MEEREYQTRRAREAQEGERIERSAAEIIVGLGAPAILGASHIAGKVIDRLPKKELEGESKKEE